MRKRDGIIDRREANETERRLGAILDHYIGTTQSLGRLERIEEEVRVPLPSRKGVRRSSRYQFVCFLDGWTYDDSGRAWLVEFKLRNRLTSVNQAQLSNQLRWYAWALEQHEGVRPFGVILDERLNEEPKPARMLISGKPSHAKDQLTSPVAYMRACYEAEVEPHEDTVEALDRRVWQQRHPILFRPGELDEAGAGLVSAAKLIRDLDSGELTPVRNASPMHCGSCKFRDICPNPTDRLFVDSLYERTVPKRLRGPLGPANGGAR
jgi:hypothetical protein